MSYGQTLCIDLTTKIKERNRQLKQQYAKFAVFANLAYLCIVKQPLNRNSFKHKNAVACFLTQATASKIWVFIIFTTNALRSVSCSQCISGFIFGATFLPNIAQSKRSFKSNRCLRAVSLAISQPASACRITPMAGSLCSTRVNRFCASSVPSATITIPACIE